MKGISLKIVKFILVLLLTFSSFFLLYSLASVFSPLVLILFIFFILESLVSRGLFLFLPSKSLFSCGSIMPFSGGGDVCVPNLGGHIILLVEIILIGSLIIYLRNRNKNLKDGRLSKGWKITGIVILIFLLISVSFLFYGSQLKEKSREGNILTNRAQEENNPNLCEEISKQDKRDWCYYRYSNIYPELELCDKILNENYKARCDKSVEGYYSNQANMESLNN